ncbi:MAG: sodium:solute symporter family protein [Bacteroidota bacterium]
MNTSLQALKPTLILLLFLGFAGLYLFFFTEATVLWAGFISMMVFYGLVFFYGAYAAGLRQTDNATDVLLAGRSIPLYIAVFTMSATWIGGGFINGTAEYTASSGLVWVQAPWGYALSLIVGGLFFARKMRRYRFKTMLDPLAQRYGKRLTALLFLPALSGELFWSAAILTALGTTFGTVLGLDAQTAILISAVIAIAYTALGGLWAVALTDVLQLSLLLLGLLLVLPFALQYVGGVDNLWAAYQQKKGASAYLWPTREALGSYYWNWWDYALLLIFGGIPWQVYFQRVLASRNEQTAMWLSILAGVVCLIVATPAVMIGMIGDVVNWPAGGMPAPESAVSILPHVMRYLTHPIVATIGLGAVAAAVMSSVDSSILSASSLASWNVYRPLFNPNIGSQQLTKMIKRFIWIIGITATFLALNIGSVYELWFLCSDFVYCLLFPALACALFDPKANSYGAFAGFLVAAILRFGGGDPTLGIPIFLPYPMIEEGVVLFPFRTLAMVSGLASIILVSRLTQSLAPPRTLYVEED